MREKGVSAHKGFYHFLINKFLRNVQDFTKGKWAKEIKLAKKLFNSYPDVTFWNQVEIDFELNSLAWFCSSEGKYALLIQRKKINYRPKKRKTYQLAKKVGKDKRIPHKKKSLMDFLNEPKKN